MHFGGTNNCMAKEIRNSISLSRSHCSPTQPGWPCCSYVKHFEFDSNENSYRVDGDLKETTKCANCQLIYGTHYSLVTIQMPPTLMTTNGADERTADVYYHAWFEFSPLHPCQKLISRKNRSASPDCESWGLSGVESLGWRCWWTKCRVRSAVTHYQRPISPSRVVVSSRL